MARDDDDKDKKKEGMSWQDILRLIGKILIIIAGGGIGVAAAYAKVAPEFGISASKAQKLFNKYHKKVNK